MNDISKEAVDALLKGVTGKAWMQHRRASLNVETVEGRSVASCGGYGNNQRSEEVAKENEANARFIAAARELVPALRAALDEAEAREAALLAANETTRETLLRHNADCDRRIRKAEAEIARLNDHIEGVALDTHKVTVGLVKERDAANALLDRLRDTDPDEGTAWFHREIDAHLGAKP